MMRVGIWQSGLQIGSLPRLLLLLVRQEVDTGGPIHGRPGTAHEPGHGEDSESLDSPLEGVVFRTGYGRSAENRALSRLLGKFGGPFRKESCPEPLQGALTSAA
jgi:hypothetical protein